MRRRNAVTILALFGLAGCSDQERFSFAGASTDFCVPTANVIHGPPWLVGFGDDHGALAFQACDGTHKGPCDVPDIVTTGTLSPTAHMRGHKWGDFYPGTEPRETTLTAIRDRTYRIIADDTHRDQRILAVHSSLMGATGAYYWRIASSGDVGMTPTSELIAECDGVNDKRSPDSPEAAYGCSRAIKIRDAAVRYTFENGVINTAFVTDLDAEVTASVDKWRCKKAT